MLSHTGKCTKIFVQTLQEMPKREWETFSAKFKRLSCEVSEKVKKGVKPSILATVLSLRFFFNLKEKTSQDKHKTSFGVWTTIELNLWVELTKPCKRQAPYIQFIHFITIHEPQAMSYELRASYKLRATSYDLRATRYEM